MVGLSPSCASSSPNRSSVHPLALARDSPRSCLRRHRSDQSLGLLRAPDLADPLRWSPTLARRPVRRSMSASRFQRSPLHCLGSRGVRVPRRCRHRRFGAGMPPVSRAACVVLHHLDGFLLLDPARVLHRTSSHGVRDVSSPRQRLPITRSYPPKPCSSCAADTVGITPLDAGPVSPSPVSRPGSPRTLPPRPWPLARPGPRGFPPLTKP